MLTITERWLPVSGYQDLYEVSDQGRVRSLDRRDSRGNRIRGLVLKPRADRDGYIRVNLCRGGVRRSARVHRLVLLAFVGHVPEGAEGCHNDGDPSNNRLENLRWDTRSENVRDRVRHGTHHNANKTHCPRGHEYTEANTYVFLQAHGGDGRTCRACLRERNLAAYRRKRSQQQLEVTTA